MTKPIHYLLVGLPYSGKSTLAQSLVKLNNFAHINIDQLKWDRGYSEVGDDDVPDSVWDAIFTDADSLLQQYLQAGISVANEYAWITRAWRDRARRVATQVGCTTKTIFLDVPRDVVLARWQSNKATKARFQWPEKEMQDILSQFELPSADEDLIIYDESLAPEIWIRNNLAL